MLTDGLDACNCRGVWGSGVALEFKKRVSASFVFISQLRGMNKSYAISSSPALIEHITSIATRLQVHSINVLY